jgi:mannose-1-phosphate guanylyltransferase
VPFHVYETDRYWNDVGSLEELRQGTFDLLGGEVGLDVSGDRVAPDLTVGEGSEVGELEVVEDKGPVWVGAGCEIAEGVRVIGPAAIGDGARIGASASLRESIVFPGTEVAPGSILIDAIAGHAGIVESLRPYEELSSQPSVG